MGMQANEQHLSLSRGERELVLELLDGGTDMALAERLVVSVWTVRSRLRSLYQRTQMKRVTLAVWASRHRNCCLNDSQPRLQQP